MEKRKYPLRAGDYQLIEAVGQGVSATVHRAFCVPFNEIVAIKILDFERNNNDLSKISREAQTMTLIDHPNVVKAHCSFVNDHDLWIVMPYMAGGSCLHIMKSAFPNGLEEAVIATILREVLKGLEYLHHHGHIHRDVKAGNILVDGRGGVKLGDFGVSVCLFDSGDRQRTRNTFVGTPCWMAPEVMEQLHGYNFKADIWSFGITALELAHGHAPFSKYPPMKVLLMTLQNAPPGLDYERDKKFSRSFRQMIAMCLVKNPSKRPTAQKLLKHSFFKQARSNDYISRKILEGLPSLGDRYQALKEKDEDLLAQKKMPEGKKEELSQDEYKRGISSWNFDLDDLKAQASLVPDSGDNPQVKLLGRCSSSLFDLGSLHECIQEDMSFSRSCSFRDDVDKDSDFVVQNKLPTVSSADQFTSFQRSISEGFGYESKALSSGDQFPSLNGLRFNSNQKDNYFCGSCGSESDEKSLDGISNCSFHERRVSTSSCSSDVPPTVKGESFKHQNQHQNTVNCNGGVSHIGNDSNSECLPKAVKLPATNAEDLEDKMKVPVVQQRGRFKVTSENVEIDKALVPPGLQKSHSLQVLSQIPASCTSLPDLTSNLSSRGLFVHLNNILQANIQQRDHILGLMKQLSSCDTSGYRSAEGVCVSSPTAITDKLSMENEREKELIQELTDLQLRFICAQEELQRLKAKSNNEDAKVCNKARDQMQKRFLAHCTTLYSLLFAGISARVSS